MIRGDDKPPLVFCYIFRRMTLYVFNPEHDLCLANGNQNYVPPESAMAFARKECGIMRVLYGMDANVIAADGYSEWYRQTGKVPSVIVAWGWDSRLKQVLLRQGAPLDLLPGDEWLERLREMQHRAYCLALQTHARRADSIEEVRQLLSEFGRVVLKAPWSGAGRGIRWVDSALTDNDELWIQKTINCQRCVMVERRFDVDRDFAIEYKVKNGVVEIIGLSLFVTQSGVYRYNILLPDDEIKLAVGLQSETEDKVTHWIENNVAPFYDGYLGVDMIRARDGQVYVSELNLRHTMGMLAHRFLQLHPENKGMKWTPNIL